MGRQTAADGWVDSSGWAGGQQRMGGRTAVDGRVDSSRWVDGQTGRQADGKWGTRACSMSVWVVARMLWTSDQQAGSWGERMRERRRKERRGQKQEEDKKYGREGGAQSLGAKSAGVLGAQIDKCCRMGGA